MNSLIDTHFAEDKGDDNGRELFNISQQLQKLGPSKKNTGLRLSVLTMSVIDRLGNAKMTDQQQEKITSAIGEIYNSSNDKKA